MSETQTLPRESTPSCVRDPTYHRRPSSEFQINYIETSSALLPHPDKFLFAAGSTRQLFFFFFKPSSLSSLHSCSQSGSRASSPCERACKLAGGQLYPLPLLLSWEGSSWLPSTFSQPFWEWSKTVELKIDAFECLYLSLVLQRGFWVFQVHTFQVLLHWLQALRKLKSRARWEIETWCPKKKTGHLRADKTHLNTDMMLLHWTALNVARSDWVSLSTYTALSQDFRNLKHWRLVL